MMRNEEHGPESHRGVRPISAPPEQQGDIEELRRVLGAGRPPKVRLVGRKQEATLPSSVSECLERVIEVLARGEAVTIVPVGRDLTTQSAANLLNVSRQYLVRLLEAGKIPFTRTGRHRRVRLKDVAAFKKRRDKDRKRSIDKLAEMTEEFGGYDELQ